MTFQRPTIFLDNRELAEETDRSVDALVDWSGQYLASPPVLRRGTDLVRVVDGRIDNLSESGLRDMLSRAARYGSSNAQGTFMPKHPPLDIVKVMLDRDARGASLGEVRSVATVPLLDTHGKLITEPGLHSSGVWYAPEIENVERHIGSVDDEVDVLAARDLLVDELLGGFDFQDQSSRANALALVLLPFVREFIGDVPTPLHAVIAPQPGTGKTTLVHTALVPGLGNPDISIEPRDEDELRKRITSALLKGRRSIFFDNLSQELASGTLAAALTSARWSDRVLGASTDVSLVSHLIWSATGNNLAASSELRDRVCPIWLQPRGGVPARRRNEDSFRHPDIIEWAREQRARLVGACLTLVLHWASGRARLNPDGSFSRDDAKRHGKRTMGSFNVWARVMGGILAEANVDGFLENRDKLDVIDPDEIETSAFFDVLRERFGDGEFTTRELVAHCQFGGALHEYVPESVGPLRDNPSHRLGRWLAKNRDATHGDIRLLARRGHRGAQIWRAADTRE